MRRFRWLFLAISIPLHATAEPALDGIGLASALQGQQRFLNGEYEAAVPLLERAVTEIEQQRGPQHPLLIEPLGFLGSARHQLGRLPAALAALERARTLTILRHGPANTVQLPLLYVAAEVHQELGATQRAESLLTEAHELLLAVEGEAHVETWIALGKLADWQSGHRDFDTALLNYHRALRELKELAGGVDSPEMLALMQGMAGTYLAEGFVPGRALPLLQRIADLTEAHPESFPPPQRVEAQLMFGDLLMRFSQERQAIEAYQRAWRIAHQAQDQHWLERLSAADKVAGRLDPSPRPPEGRDFFVFEYDLAADGRPTRIRLAETNADPVVARWAGQRFRDMRFRPPISDGRPRALADQTGTFVY